jgi:hypothetical protein
MLTIDPKEFWMMPFLCGIIGTVDPSGSFDILLNSSTGNNYVWLFSAQTLNKFRDLQRT